MNPPDTETKLPLHMILEGHNRNELEQTLNEWAEQGYEVQSFQVYFNPTIGKASYVFHLMHDGEDDVIYMGREDYEGVTEYDDELESGLDMRLAGED